MPTIPTSPCTTNFQLFGNNAKEYLVVKFTYLFSNIFYVRVLFSQSHYISCICTKEAKSQPFDYLINLQIFQEYFHLLLRKNMKVILLLSLISLKTFSKNLLYHKIIHLKSRCCAGVFIDHRSS